MTDLTGLPDRYHVPLRLDFDSRVKERLAPGCRVLDIGSGRHPAFASAERPEGVHYVGLDLSTSELEAAGEGAYDEMVEADASTFIPAFTESFDLVVSWQVLEHVPDMAAALENARRYLKPGDVSWPSSPVPGRLSGGSTGSCPTGSGRSWSTGR